MPCLSLSQGTYCVGIKQGLSEPCQSSSALFSEMKFLLAALVLMAGACAQDTYNCPDGWLLEVRLADFFYPHIISLIYRKTEVGADASCLAEENLLPGMMLIFFALSMKLGWLSLIILESTTG